MTDKFVVSTNEIGRIIVTDVETGNVYHYGNMGNFLGLIRLLNELSEENEQLRKENERQNNEIKLLRKEIIELNDKNQHLLDLIYYTPTFITPTPIGLPYDNIYHRTSKQLENHLKDNGFPVDAVSRSTVGDLSFYHVEFNLSDDEWEYEKTSDLQMRGLLGIRNVGLVDFHIQDGMIHEVILVSVKELDDKYLKDGNLVFK